MNGISPSLEFMRSGHGQAASSITHLVHNGETSYPDMSIVCSHAFIHLDSLYRVIDKECYITFHVCVPSSTMLDIFLIYTEAILFVASMTGKELQSCYVMMEFDFHTLGLSILIFVGQSERMHSCIYLIIDPIGVL